MQFTLIYSTNIPEYTVCIVQYFCKVPSDFYKYEAVSHDWRT